MSEGNDSCKMMEKVLSLLGFVEQEDGDWTYENVDEDVYYCVARVFPSEFEKEQNTGHEYIMVGQYWRAGRSDETVFDDAVELSTFILEIFD